ncbi:MAG TPA: NAD-dependent epimerase/dehydratase family protein [Phycisphaerae bacterium]
MPDERPAAIRLVTGSTGLLGSHIVEQLRSRGRRVRALVRPGSDDSFLRAQGAEVVTGDVTDRASLERACAGVDTLYHAAARVGDWGPWREFVQITIEGTHNLIAAAAAAGVRRFLHISSISVYGYVNGKGVVLDETAPLGQNLYRWAYYTRSKVIAEQAVWEAHHAGRIRATVIRPSWLYGPRDRATLGRLIDSIRLGKCRLIGDGSNRLNVVHAANVAEGAILAAENQQALGEAYNLSNDGVLTQKQYFDTVARALGRGPIERRVPYGLARRVAFVLECLGHLLGQRKPPLITRYSVWLIGRHSFFETRKAREQLGWKSRISYEEGIPAAVTDYLQQRAASECGPALSMQRA